MKHIVLPPENRISYYLACEEYVAQHVSDECFMVWEPVRPTVVVGRNQLIADEVNLDYCRSHGISLVRRKSGGGCIFADEGCVFFSYVGPYHGVEAGFEDYNRRISDVLRAAGLPVEVSGRNDIMLHGRKIAGAAFYRLGDRSILHTTMLFKTNIETLVRAITPSDEKLISKGVHSVRQHVLNAGDYTSMTAQQLREFMRERVCGDDELRLSHDAVKEILEMEKVNTSDEFVFGSNPAYSLERSARFPGLGGIKASIDVKDNRIRRIVFSGDFFFDEDANAGLAQMLTGLPFERGAVSEALSKTNGDFGVMNLTKERLLELLFGAKKD